jgi:ribosomal protein S28E/S33
VEILENKGTCAKVRILEGRDKGRIGWIQTEFIKSKNSL